MSSARKPALYILRVALLGVTPEIWRVLAVPASITLPRLHRVLQIAMGWGDYHLHQFDTREGPFGTPDPDFPDGTLDEGRVRLSRFLKKPRDRIHYEYDFGAGACPPEDVGGPPGYADFLEAISNPGHPDHHDFMQWIGGHFDSEAFDEAAVNRALARC